jgi:mannose-6-phosphate isomerase-like protein (cupin superfamily)
MPTPPKVLWMPGGVRTEIHLAGEDTGGAFCLIFDQPPAGWSLPAHLHRGVAETIHVLEGEFEITVAGRRSRLGPGEGVHVPADVVHAGVNVGPAGGRRLVIFSPAGMEGFFEEVGAGSPQAAAPPAAALASATRHGWRFDV